MKRTNKLTSKSQNLVLEYEVRGKVITVTKYTKNKNKETKYLLTNCSEETQRELCSLLWLANATPCTAKELAEELLECIIK